MNEVTALEKPEPKLKAMRDEKGVKANVKILLDHYGWFWWMPPANAYGRSGISDFHCIKDGVFIALETKFGANKPTPPQRAFLETIQANDGFGFVVNEKNLEHLSWFLKDFSREAQRVGEEGTVNNEAGARMLDALSGLMHLTH